MPKLSKSKNRTRQHDPSCLGLHIRNQFHRNRDKPKHKIIQLTKFHPLLDLLRLSPFL
jgi:hypothetical protein